MAADMSRAPEPIRSKAQTRMLLAEGGLLAMPRDASWERCPSTTSGGQYHAVDASTLRASCGQPMMPYTEVAIPLADVPEWQRCGRNGCRQAFAKHDEEQSNVR